MVLCWAQFFASGIRSSGFKENHGSYFIIWRQFVHHPYIMLHIFVSYCRSPNSDDFILDWDGLYENHLLLKHIPSGVKCMVRQ